MISLLFSFFINLTVVSTFAYFSETKISLDLRTAGDALANTFEERGKYIWALGLFASGQSSTLTGGLAGQYVIQVKRIKKREQNNRLDRFKMNLHLTKR